MAGPSLISGLAGSIGGQGGQQGGQPGNELLSLISAVQQIQGQKKEQARGDFQLMMQMLTEHGIVPEQKVFERTAKDAGLPIDQITKALDPNQVVKTGNSLQPKQGAQSAFPVSDSAASKNPGGGVVQTTSPSTTQAGVATGNKAQAQSPFDSLVSRAKERVETLHSNEMLKQHNVQRIEQLRVQAMDGDPEALGQLMAGGGMEFNAEQLGQAHMTKEEKAKLYRIAKGFEEGTVAKDIRLSNSANSLFSTGRFANLQDARAAAEGKQVNMLPDLGRMADEAKVYNELFAATGDAKIAKEVGMKMANGVSLANAVPEGIQPVLQQQLDLQRRVGEAQISGEEARTDIAKRGLAVQLAEQQARVVASQRQAALDAQQFALDLEQKLNDREKQEFSSFVDLKRAGVKIDPTLEQGMLDRLATKAGMVPEKVQSWWRYVTFRGYEHTEYKADLSRDQSLLDQAAPKGGSNTPGKALNAITNGLKSGDYIEHGQIYRAAPPESKPKNKTNASTPYNRLERTRQGGK